MQYQVVNPHFERVKELSCLYKITSIAAKQNSLDPTLKEIVEILPTAWRFANSAIAEIKLGDAVYTSSEITGETIAQNAVVLAKEIPIATVSIHYPISLVYDEPFLDEEQDLLNIVALELAIIIEREERKVKQKEIEEHLKRNDRLTILGEITAGIAHELNTPLANILGFAQFIHQEASNEQIRKDSDKIIKSAIHAREIVKKLMFFSCDMPQFKGLLNLNKTVLDATVLLKPMLSEKGINLIIIDDEKNIEARFDQIQLTQVVFNLVINAINACAKNGEIKIIISRKNQNAVLVVKDNGIGIKEELLNKIFEPFYSSKREKSGTGLGLSVVHGIIKSHHGKLEVQSTPNMGTTFIIELPLGLND